jgi:plasmid maintenance system antidote protein VapI
MLRTGEGELNRLYGILNGQSATSPDMALKLERAVGGTANSWLAMQMN